jgi:O-acetyl-ADP-ribose deacetylase (regulator of RNase III)
VFNIYRTRVTIAEGDPLLIRAEGLLIAANDHLWMGGGTAGRVKQAGGEAIEVEAVRQGPVVLGSSVATAAGELPFRRIYHVVVMGQDLKVRHDQIGPALASSLKLASRDGLSSVLIAPLESEDLIGPFHEATRQVVAALFDRLADEKGIREVILAAGRAEARDAYRAAFLELLGGGKPGAR